MRLNSKQLRKSILKVESGAKKGTAFLVAPDIAITVAHVIEDDKNIIIDKNSEIKIEAKLDEKLDIAILKLNKKLTSGCLQLYDEQINEQDKWITFGYPSFNPIQGQKLDGLNNEIDMVIDLEEGEKTDIQLKYDDKIKDYSGFSGSPLIVNNKVVGIINTQKKQQGDPIRLKALSTEHFRKLVEKETIKIHEKNNIESDFEELEAIKIDLSVEFSSCEHMTSLFFQPEIKLEQEVEFGPLVIQDKKNHIEKITHLLSLAKDNAKNGLSKDINFILMPEHSISGVEGVDYIIKELKDSTINQQIIISGIDGLTKNDFINLLDKSSFEYTLKDRMINWAKKQSEHKWFSSTIIIEKYKEVIKYYLQPKIFPSSNKDVVEGSWMLFFSTNYKDTSLNFFSLCCCDWIGSVDGKKYINILGKLIREKGYINKPSEHCIAFIPQCNLNQNYRGVEESIKEFLNNCLSWKKVHGRNALAVMINAAEDEKELKETSIIINNGNYNCEDEVLPTYSVIRKNTLEDYNNIRFRKKKQCIHAIELALPFSIDDTSDIKKYPCKQTVVHTIDGNCIEGDPRYPNPPNDVCGYKKTINDFIDKIEQENNFKIEIQDTFVESIYNSILNEKCSTYRNIDKDEIIKIFNSFFKYSNYNKYKKNCDYWSIEIEGNLFEQFISILGIFKLVEFNIEKSSIFHAKLIVSRITYDVLITYIAESEINATTIFRNLVIDKIEDKIPNRLIVLATGNVSSRALRKLTQGSNNRFASLISNEVIFYKVDKLIEDILEKIDDFNEIAQLRGFIEEKLGGRG